MKFSCEKSLLQSMITISSRTVASKSSIPALEGILIECGSQLRLTGYNMKTGIRCIVPAELIEKGNIVLSARLFGDIVRRLPDDLVTVSTKEYTVTIQCGDSEFHILGMDAEEFPDLPNVEYQNSISISQKKLQSMINQTIFAVSSDDSRPVHTGSLFELDDNGLLTVVSVDGFRLALRREQVDGEQKSAATTFIVPAHALREVANICSDVDYPIDIVEGEKQIMFRVGDITLITRRLEGNFLNYRQAIPQENPMVVQANRKALIASIDRCSLIITEQQKSPLLCKFGDNRLELQTATPIGTAYDICPIHSDGRTLDIGFNNKYLLDALKAAPAEDLVLRLNTPVSPCVIQPAEQTPEHDFVYMVLPVRMKS